MSKDAVKADKPKSKKKTIIIIVAVVVVAAILAVVLLSGGSDYSVDTSLSEADYKAKCETLTYDDVARDTDSYKGKYALIKGQVIQVVETDDDVGAIRVSADSSADQVWYVQYDKTSVSLLEDDYVIVYGEVAGEVTYESIVGTEISIPAVNARFVETTTYAEAMHPSLKTVEYTDVWADSRGCALAVNKIEIAADQTRIYVTVANNTSGTVDLYTSSGVLVQNNSQMEESWDYDYTDDEVPSEIQPGVTVSGVLVFDAVDQNSPFTFKLEGSDANFDSISYEFTLNG